MIVVAVAAMLATMAVPAYRDMTVRNHMVTEMNTLGTALSVAKSAAQGGGDVVICKAADPLGCPSSVTNCCVTSGDWSQGWVIFMDDNNDQKMVKGDGDKIVKIGEPLSGVAAITGTGNSANWVMFTAGGAYMPNNDANVIKACPAGFTGNTLGRTLASRGTISNAGPYTCP